ncbi:MAG: ribonuclease HII [Clostridiales Family XIII bacterium]|jgi:ribonuclease HII|nr:ribonuclease HII [Clostridiales Family XIII bacterium]
MKKDEREILLIAKLAEMKRYEDALHAQGLRYVAGIDEVGRGPLAGPVCAAAVVLPVDFDILGIDDSKKLSEKKREYLCEKIIEKAVAYGIGMIDNNRIDEINILNATKEAMLIAIQKASQNLQIEHLLIDAVKLPEAGIPGTAIIKGDQKSVSIAAASIVAKVTRDKLMVEFDEIYPGYAFAANKGYGTKAHYEGLARLGRTPIHRKTFLSSQC